jgi:hypothetical protein
MMNSLEDFLPSGMEVLVCPSVVLGKPWRWFLFGQAGVSFALTPSDVLRHFAMGGVSSGIFYSHGWRLLLHWHNGNKFVPS